MTVHYITSVYYIMFSHYITSVYHVPFSHYIMSVYCITSLYYYGAVADTLSTTPAEVFDTLSHLKIR